MDYKNSVLASLVGGVVMGIILTLTGSLTAVALLVGSSSILVAWIVHLVISAALGLVYAGVYDNWVKQRMKPLAAGLLYGFVWYLLGALTLMPLVTGLGLQWSAAAVAGTLDSLVAHLAYGLVLGWARERLVQGVSASKAAA